MIKPEYDKNGRSIGSKLDQLMSISKMTKKPISELVKLEELKPDITILYILDHFYDLKNLEKITYSEIKCYCECMDVNLEPEEIETILKIERIYNSSLR
jgi:hypothetical protein